jgi:septal ring factor EnvC (AmiA/AmiB activator)
MYIMDIDINAVIQTIYMVSLALIALVYGIKKVTKDWRLSETETSVLDLMHQELSRMSAQNTVLSTELNKLQQEIIQLNAQLRKLCIENDKLQVEVIALTMELNGFKKLASVRSDLGDANATS